MVSPATVTVFALMVAVAPLLQAAAAPPPSPVGEESCVSAGGQCVTAGGCADWLRPLPEVCGPGRDCCFQDYSSHSLSCGTFGGECTSEASCGGAPRHPNAFCPTAGHVCCVWLF